MLYLLSICFSNSFKWVSLCIFFSMLHMDSHSQTIVITNTTKSSKIIPIKGPSIQQSFDNPPDSVKPSCFWFWLNSAVNEAGIKRDLEEFKSKGMGGVLLICSSNWSPGPVFPLPNRGPDFLSLEWQKLFKYSLSEAARLGLEVGVNFCGSGWAMGGPWITPEYNGRWFVQSEMKLSGPQKFSGKLPMPDPRGGYKPPYMLNVVASMKWPREKMDYRDNAIVAFKEADNQADSLGNERGLLLDPKSNRKDGDCMLLPTQVMEPTLTSWASLPADKAILSSDVIDLTNKVKPDGSLNWDVPDGKWTIIRTGNVATGAPLSLILPEMKSGDALAVDWLNPASVDVMFKHFGNIILKIAGPLVGKTLKYFHTDSFEDGYPNWTNNLLEKFKDYRGYDPAPYTPVFAGKIIGSAEISDRFLYDYRKTVADLFADGCYKRLKERSNKLGMLAQNEASGPSWSGTVCIDALKNLGRVDNPMGEFWNGPTFVINDQNYVGKQTSSAAHIYGRKTVSAEALTSVAHWQEAPERLKPVVDRAFCEGINRIVFHTMTSQRPSDGMPGFEYGAGTHFNPNVTWWNQAAGSWIAYNSRCTALLQSGLFVGDVLFYNGDWAPNLVDAKHIDPSLGKGYDYDVCNAEVLMTRLGVKNGRIVLPDGMSYRVLSLPNTDFMPVEVVNKIRELVEAGATVIGPKPDRDPGLHNYPQCDKEVRETAAYLWGYINGTTIKERKVGKGRIITGKSLREVLMSDGILPDFETKSTDSSTFIDFIHRTTSEAEIFFLANRKDKSEKIECTFRVDGRKPELWDPVSGKRRALPEYATINGRTTIPMEFKPYDAIFIIFPKNPTIELVKKTGLRNFVQMKAVYKLIGSWTVQFNKEWFYPVEGLPQTQANGKVRFDSLVDWSKSPYDAIRYFSGTATYKKSFEVPGKLLEKTKDIFLDLGTVKETARVRLNGIDLGVVWCKPWNVNVSKALKNGNNELEVEVVNLWPNRLIGDASIPVGKEKGKTVTNISIYNSKSALLPSGLLGPVTIQEVDR